MLTVNIGLKTEVVPNHLLLSLLTKKERGFEQEDKEEREEAAQHQLGAPPTLPANQWPSNAEVGGQSPPSPRRLPGGRPNQGKKLKHLMAACQRGKVLSVPPSRL